MQDDDDTADAAALDEKELLTLDFKMPAPSPLAESQRSALVRTSITRIWDGAGDLAPGASAPVGGPGSGPQEMWMLLIMRMITRVMDTDHNMEGQEGEDGRTESQDSDENALALYERQDRLRQVLCDYIMTDFSER